MDGVGGVSRLQFALDWAARGFKIFPLTPGTKKPAIDGWPLLATRDESQIRSWWMRRDFNIGVLTDDMIVVDVDMKNGKNGMASLLSIVEDYDDLDTLTVTSPSGGQHAYYSGPSRSLSAGRLGSGLDIRSYHGYVVAPGSYIDQGLDPTAGCSGYYTLDPDRDRPVRPVPQAILSRLDAPIDKRDLQPVVQLDRPAAVDTAIHYLRHDAKPAVEGQGGDNQTFYVACWVKDLGVSEELAYDLLLEHYNDRCSPPWQGDELREKVANAYKHGSRAPGGGSPEVGFAGVSIPAPERPNAAPAVWFRAGDAWDPNQAWLYYQVLPAKGVVVLTARSQSGKTFLLIDLAASLSRGTPWFDIEPDERGGTIFLFSGSEGTDFELRLAAAGLGADDPVSATRVGGLGERGAMGALLEQIREEAARMQERHGVPLRLIVLETLSASGMVEDENNSAEAAKAIANLETLSRALGVPVLFSHHPPKEGSGSRGSGAFTDNADYWLEIEREGTQSVRTLWLQKARGAMQRRLGSFSLVPVQLATDNRGRPVVSMTVSSGTVDAAPSSSSVAVENAQLLIECLDWALIDHGMEVDGRDAAPFEDVKAIFRERKPGSKDASRVSRAWKPGLEFACSTGAVEDFTHGGQRYLRKREMI